MWAAAASQAWKSEFYNCQKNQFISAAMCVLLCLADTGFSSIPPLRFRRVSQKSTPHLDGLKLFAYMRCEGRAILVSPVGIIFINRSRRSVHVRPNVLCLS